MCTDCQGKSWPWESLSTRQTATWHLSLLLHGSKVTPPAPNLKGEERKWTGHKVLGKIKGATAGVPRVSMRSLFCVSLGVWCRH